MEIPEVRYAENDGVHIAYCRWGSGEPVVYVPPFVTNVEIFWELEEARVAGERSGKFFDVLAIDKRGVGMSDRSARPPTINDRVADCLAVMDAEGFESAHIIGFSEGAGIAVAMASQCPERVRSVVLQGGPLLGVSLEEIEPYWAEGDPPFPDIEETVADLIESWGKDARRAMKWWAPDAIGNERIEAWYAKFQRQSASPGTLRAHIAANAVGDLTNEFDTITCPIMIAHCRFDPLVPVAWARYLSARRPDAELRLWDSRNHVAELDPKWEQSQSEVIEWILGFRPAPSVRSKFAVVMFTDIVGSTTETARHGDEDWSNRMAAHDELADKVIGTHEGRRVKSTGDGLLAVFSDPGHAVAAALRLQDEIGSLGLEVRAGIHAGQVQEQSDGDVLGIAVITAARLEGHAPSGGVAVSRTMSDLLLGDSRFAFESIGPAQLAGIDEPVEVFVVDRA